MTLPELAIILPLLIPRAPVSSDDGARGHGGGGGGGGGKKKKKKKKKQKKKIEMLSLEIIFRTP